MLPGIELSWCAHGPSVQSGPGAFNFCVFPFGPTPSMMLPSAFRLPMSPCACRQTAVSAPLFAIRRSDGRAVCSLVVTISGFRDLQDIPRTIAPRV